MRVCLLNRFHNDNMNFSINSDDPGIMGKTLVDDYVMAHNDIGLSYEAIKKSVSPHGAYYTTVAIICDDQVIPFHSCTSQLHNWFRQMSDFIL